QNGFAHEDVALSVVVQRMVDPVVSGILFTADPVSGQRHVTSIDAGFGLGEALVSGLVTADLYRVDRRGWRVVERRISRKALAIRPLPGGGTEHVALTAEEGQRPSLTDDQAIALARLGDRVADHYGTPQDIEWCIDAAGTLFIVQSRPITTLFPIPAPYPQDGATHIFISFGHVQVMTDPFTPIGRAALGRVFPFAKDDAMAPSRIIAEAAGRPYVDVAPMMAFGPARRIVPRALTVADGQMAAALGQVLARPEVVAGLARQARPVRGRDIARFAGPMLPRIVAWLCWRDVDGAAARLAQIGDDYVATVRSNVRSAPAGAARVAAAEREVAVVFARLLPRFIPVIAAAMISRLLLLRLGAAPDDVAEVMRGLLGNVTTDMDLEVGDLADLARPHPALVDILTSRPPAAALAAAPGVEGGPAFLAALDAFLARYGMRGGGEIDLGRPRWADDPSPLIAVIAGNLAHAQAGAHRTRHAELAAIGAAAVARLTATAASSAARRGPLGALRARLVGRLARDLRGLMAVREHPKFVLIRVFGLLRDAVAEAAAPVVAAGRLGAIDDAWMLRFDEIERLVRDPAFDARPIVATRRAEMARFAAMRPPRLITSDGEIPEVTIAQGDAPDGALVGTAASAGIVEGIAHVVTDPGGDVLQKGEILIAPFTDPGWTPLFINAAGLVMEVGGLMTHGSVVAREYGIPAVVGVPDAVARLRTGMRVRVNGDGGWVEIVDGEG
ncbi:MAG: PEP/pyruvate-binding domain-containing protein, partial [Ardenticatenales bacterium]